MICPYCRKLAVPGTGAQIYPYRADLHGKQFWVCWVCHAWVGCHDDDLDRPLGRLANAELRQAKIAAHTAFDRIWRGKIRRGAAYRWLAAQLGIEPRDCHIGMFDVEHCRRVVTVCEEAHERQILPIV